MKIHEYQAKEILRKYNVPVPTGHVAYTVDGAVQAAKEIKGKVKVVKAQIHAGGRGKGGGVKVAKGIPDVRKYAKQILGMNLITHQTGPEGRIVKRLLIEQGVNIAKELYVGITLDRAQSKNVMMVSTEGGVEIEKVAAETPEKIIKEIIEPGLGMQPYQARRLAYALGFEGDLQKKAVKFLRALYNVYEKTDASLTEINPLVVTKEGDIIALDAKMNFDDNALYRLKDIAEYRDLEEEDALEVEASKYNLNYINIIIQIINKHFYYPAKMKLGKEDLERMKQWTQKNVIEEMRSYRGSDIQLMVYDKIEGEVKTYTMFYLLRWGNVEFMDKKRFQNSIPEKYKAFVAKYERFVSGFCVYHGKNDEPRSIYLKADSPALFGVVNKPESARVPEVLRGFTLHTSKGPKEHSISQLNEILSEKKMLCMIVDGNPYEKKILYNLGNFFFLYPLYASGKEYSVVFGNDALYMDCFLKDRRDHERERFGWGQ